MKKEHWEIMRSYNLFEESLVLLYNPLFKTKPKKLKRGEKRQRDSTLTPDEMRQKRKIVAFYYKFVIQPEAHLKRLDNIFTHFFSDFTDC